MHLDPIINQTAINFAKGAAYGAAYGALINPVVSVGAGAVLGAVALSTEFLVDRIAFSKLLELLKTPSDVSNFITSKVELLSLKLNAIESPVLQLIAKISLMFALVVALPAGMILPSYAGLYAGKYALAALGFKATIVPSLTLAAKFILATFACNLGVGMAISSVKFLWNNTFSRAPQGQAEVA
jgi:hypothetical protein